MDPRQPQHPFARSNSSQYVRAPFQQTSNQAPFPPSSHPQAGPPPPPGYPEPQRRTSDATYYVPPRSYAQDAPSMPAPTSSSRHQSSSSIGHGTPVNRNMPPPSSPQQQHQQQQTQHVLPPPLPRGPPPSLGAPMSSLTAGRDLPTLPPLHRPGSSMSISSMLGNPATSTTRESSYQPPQFPGPLTFSNGAHPSTSYPPSRGLISVAEPSSAFGRQIRTPEPTRPQELPGPRDNRANSAGSPPRGLNMLTSPEISRYNTPQSYSQRPGQGSQMVSGEDRREPYPVRVPNMSLPPRPNSQPAGYSAPPPPPPPPPRPADMGRSEIPLYARHVYGSDREPAYAYAERERQEKEAAIIRERDRENREREFQRERERELHPDRERQERERQEAEAAMQREAIQREQSRREFEDRNRVYAAERSRQEHLEREQQRAQEQRALNRELEQRERERERENEQRRGYLEKENERAREHANNIPPPYVHQQPHHQYGRQYEPREQVPWARPAYEHPPPDLRQQQQQASYEPPQATQPTYPPAPAAHQPNDTRYPQPAMNHHVPATVPQNYESSLHDRQRREMAQSQQPFAYPSTGQPGPSLYQPHDSPQRKQEDELKMMQQQRERSAYLAVGGQQEINRRGRLSPLPQAVQGAQSQSTCPVVEPGIKSEFGKMFSGIGSGAIGMGATNTSISHTPFSNPRQSHREESEMNNPGHDTNGEAAVKANVANRGGRRRKLKEDENRDEDGSSPGRRTPSSRGQSKRPKINHPPAGSSSGIQTNALNNRRADAEHAPQSNGTPFKNTQGTISPVSDMKGQAGVVIPHHHHVVRTHHHHHHHHHHHSVPQSHKPPNISPPGRTIPRAKHIVKNKLVLDSVAHLPRYHLGSTVYSSDLKPSNPSAKSAARVRPSRRGFSSTPTPLPWFEERENCTFTVQVPQVYLSKQSREEITARRYVWGTDIYSDDSDVIAACIHAGWIRGEWPEDVDVSLLDLEIDVPDAPEASGKAATSGKKKKTTTKQVQVLTEPPPRGPMLPPKNKDLHITILVLPLLEKYSSTTRWGIMSREWSSRDHDGLSFMITEIKWVDANVKGLSLRDRKKVGKRMRTLVRDDGDKEGDEEIEKAPWGSRRDADAMDLDSGGGRVGGRLQESFIRGDGAGPIPPNSKFKGLGMGSWWLRGDGKEKEVRCAGERESGEGAEKEVVFGEKNRSGEAAEKERAKEGVDHDQDKENKAVGVVKEEERIAHDDVAEAAIQGLTALAAGGDRERAR